MTQTSLPLVDLLIECQDALESFAYDPGDRHRHVELLLAAEQDASMRSSHRELLSRIRAFFQKQLKNCAIIVIEPPPELAELVADVNAELATWNASRYVYHGTIVGKLKPIFDGGLMPGLKSAWSGREDLREQCARAVFFSTTWRSAANWSLMTHAKSRGPRNGKSRTRAVLRLSSDGLMFSRDPYSPAGNGLMVEGIVDVRSADVFAGALQGFPTWVPLADFLKQR